MKFLRRIYELNNKDSSFISSLLKKIALISISLGLFSVIISSFILDGFKNEIKNKIYSFSGHYDISSYSNGLSFKNSPLNLNDGVSLNYKNLDIIESVHPYILNSALFQGEKNNIEGVIFKGVDKSFITKIESFIDKYNDDIDFSESVIISSDLSKKLFIDVNDTLTIFFPNDPPVFRRLKVKGVFSTGLEEIDNLVAFGDIQLSRKIYKWNEQNASGIHVFVKNYEEDSTSTDKIKSISSYDEYIQSTKSKYVQIFDWLTLLDKNVIIFFIIVVIVACFNMLSMVFIIIMEKTSLIGTLKSFGARKKLIYSIFFKTAFNLSIKGVVVGNILSLIFYLIQNEYKIIKLNKSIYYLDFVPVDLNIINILSINIILIIMIIISIYIPIFFLNRIRVINSIKFS
ncbi:MAG: FtsX-like permease family protein [Flammeovirgaceae bacterium]